MSTTEFMKKVLEWEEAWSDYVNTLEAEDHWQDWAGEDFVTGVARLVWNRRDAENRLRAIDHEFCATLGI